jgi:uncharacterized repeat protein (TIGR03806 family)
MRATARKLLIGFLVAGVGLAGIGIVLGRAEPSADTKPYGLDHRTPWTTSRVVGTPEPPPPYVTERIFPRLKVEQPIYMVAEPGSDRYFVVGRYGKVWLIPDRQDVENAELLFELKDREAYSLALHPDYKHNGFIYLFSNHYKLKPQKDLVSRFTVSRGKTLTCRADSEQEIVAWQSDGHDGGCLAFGADGFLYISVGDSTGGSDPIETGQDLSDLLASLIRIDVDHPVPGQNYSIPKDNPFVGFPKARPEIWAYGLRNPWRLSFDPPTGELWVGDVGQDLWEMIYLVRRGGNYGWSVREGSHPFQPRRKQGPTPILPPVAEHPHSEARSIIGGFVYRGTQFPELHGAYVYGDYESGTIWEIHHEGDKFSRPRVLAHTALKIVAFNQDRKGEILIVSLNGEIHRLAHNTETKANPHFPKRLSDTGLFASVPKHEPAPGLIPYSVNSPLWSDNASKERYLALPENAQIEFKADEAWDLPVGAVLVKTFSLEMEPGNPASRRRIETRLLTRQTMMWRGFSYRWNEQQTDAELVPDSGVDATYDIREGTGPSKHSQTWRFPSRTECMICHTRAAGFVLGMNTLQMNRVHDYGKVADNQLRTLDHLDIFRNHLTAAPATLPHLPDPNDAKATIDARARSYIHTNCSICHQVDGGGNARMELRFSTPLDKTSTVRANPQQETFGIANARLVAPGDPEHSLLYQRMLRTGPGRMPPLATAVVDPKGTELVREWIKGIK